MFTNTFLLFNNFTLLNLPYVPLYIGTPLIFTAEKVVVSAPRHPRAFLRFLHFTLPEGKHGRVSYCRSPNIIRISRYTKSYRRVVSFPFRHVLYEPRRRSEGRLSMRRVGSTSRNVPPSSHRTTYAASTHNPSTSYLDLSIHSTIHEHSVFASSILPFLTLQS